MNLTTFVSSVVVSLALTVSASAQWAAGGSGFSVGVGGSYSRTTLPNGKVITNNNVNWGVGMGGVSTYGAGYGYGGMGYGYGGYGGMGYGGAMVMPYYGGGCYPTVIPYSPFTRCYGTPMYAPQYPCVPAAYLPQAPICW